MGSFASFPLVQMLHVTSEGGRCGHFEQQVFFVKKNQTKAKFSVWVFQVKTYIDI